MFISAFVDDFILSSLASLESALAFLLQFNAVARSCLRGNLSASRIFIIKPYLVRIERRSLSFTASMQ